MLFLNSILAPPLDQLLLRNLDECFSCIYAIGKSYSFLSVKPLLSITRLFKTHFKLNESPPLKRLFNPFVHVTTPIKTLT